MKFHARRSFIASNPEKHLFFSFYIRSLAKQPNRLLIHSDKIMKTKLIFVIVAACVCFACCNKWDEHQDDTIKLSATEYTFGAEGGDFEITTKGEHWGNGYAEDKSSGRLYYGEKVMEKELDGEEIPDTEDRQSYFNTTGQKREFFLGLPDHDYRGIVEITQKAAQ